MKQQIISLLERAKENGRTIGDVLAEVQGMRPVCLTCDDHGAVGNFLDTVPCPDCASRPARPEPTDAELATLASEFVMSGSCSTRYYFDDRGFARAIIARYVAHPAASAAPAAKVDHTPPYSNCSFRLCDLPGQCRGEGKCHHPAPAAAEHSPVGDERCKRCGGPGWYTSHTTGYPESIPCSACNPQGVSVERLAKDPFLVAQLWRKPEDFADAYEGAREDLAIWKRRALEAERDLRAERETSSRLVAALNAESGPTHMGERAALASAPVAGEAQPVAWENFPAYLIDHCEGDTITEEGIQRALSNMLIDQKYTAPQASPSADGRDAKDAERYRWLRNPANSEGPDMVSSCDPTRLDYQIDAAIAAQQGEGGA
ncbi:hypothetical protein [Bordetella trematum]|uniref:hypothetical protein n=1 Tax=Bordetella trematum TaxID=123899 RepID=UPI003AF3B3B8